MNVFVERKPYQSETNLLKTVNLLPLAKYCYIEKDNKKTS